MSDDTLPSLLSDDALPSFDRPPVVETVLGVQFKSLPGFCNAHLGAFWKDLGGEWCKLLGKDWSLPTDAPTLESTFERFEGSEGWAPLRSGFRLTGDPSARLQIRSATGDAMIQLQNGRLHYNWLGKGGGDYPRYDNVRPRFDELLGGFKAFASNEGLGELLPNQWEVTYVNHMPKGSVWRTPSDWPSVLVGLPGAWAEPSAVQLESFSGAWHFQIDPQRGRLHVEIRHARAGSAEGPEVLRLTLTARGPASDEQSVGQGLDLGRKAIVTTFKEITSSKAHEYWGLKT